MWDLPGPGLEPVSPALAGGFLTTAPPWKPCGDHFVVYRNVESLCYIPETNMSIIPQFFKKSGKKEKCMKPFCGQVLRVKNFMYFIG